MPMKSISKSEHLLTSAQSFNHEVYRNLGAVSRIYTVTGSRRMLTRHIVRIPHGSRGTAESDDRKQDLSTQRKPLGR